MALKLTMFMFLISAFETGFIDATVPSGYTHIRSTRAHYKLYTDLNDWYEAASTCRSEGARLFHPDSAEELELVWRTLDVGDNGWIHSGISDLELREYVTMDGRPIDQVYNEWQSGQPYSGWYHQYHCGRLHPSTHKLYIEHCADAGRFICKHVTAANASYVAALEQQLANQTATVKLLEQKAASLKLLLENIVVVIENQALQLKQNAVAETNQAAALNSLTKALQRYAANRTADVERQALAMEMFVGPQENNEQ